MKKAIAIIIAVLLVLIVILSLAADVFDWWIVKIEVPEPPTGYLYVSVVSPSILSAYTYGSFGLQKFVGGQWYPVAWENMNAGIYDTYGIEIKMHPFIPRRLCTNPKVNDAYMPYVDLGKGQYRLIFKAGRFSLFRKDRWHTVIKEFEIK